MNNIFDIISMDFKRKKIEKISKLDGLFMECCNSYCFEDLQICQGCKNLTCENCINLINTTCVFCATKEKKCVKKHHKYYICDACGCKICICYVNFKIDNYCVHNYCDKCPE